jgi:anti-sigma factor RsiW
VIDFGRSCARHRSALVDFADRGEIGPATAAALAHLDRCDRCTAAIESMVLTVTALRRYADTLDAEPSPDAWPRLVERITKWRRRPLAMSPLAGIAMSLAMVIVVVLPFRLGSGDLVRGAGAAERSLAPVADTQPDAIRAGKRPSVTDDFQPRISLETIRYQRREVVSDDVVVTMKEVTPSKSISRVDWRV